MNSKIAQAITLSLVLSNHLLAGGIADCPTDANGNYLVIDSEDNGAQSNLRACVYHAGKAGVDAKVTFDNDMVITLNDPILINGDYHITIDAENNDITINGDNTTEIFKDANSNKITLKNLMLEGGLDDDVSDGGGGALLVDSLGTVEIKNLYFDSNIASGDNNGGAIYAKARAVKDTTPSITIEDSVFSQNSAKIGASIYLEDNVSISISNTRFSYNTTQDGCAAVMAKADANVSITQSSFFRNKVTYSDDLSVIVSVLDNSYLLVEDSNFSENIAAPISIGSDGVALISSLDSDVTINSSQFIENNSSIMLSMNSTYRVSDSTFIANNNLDDFHRMFYFISSNAVFQSSQILNNSHFGNMFEVVSSTFDIFSSTINSNIAVDSSMTSLFVDSNVTIADSEFDSNTNSATVVFYHSRGDIDSSSVTNNDSFLQLYTVSSIQEIKNSTISLNTDINSTILCADANLSIDSSTIYNNINTDLSTLSAGILDIQDQNGNYCDIDVANTILINNTVDGVEKNSNHNFSTLIYSIVGDDVNATTTHNNQFGVDPKLNELATEGNTKIHSLKSDSPAINSGNTLLQYDQRGEKRDSSPDIGAYERKSMSLSPVYYLLMF
jgi:predicted outer membrane repeat protein